MKPHVTKYGTPEELATAAAQLFVDEMRAALIARGRFFVMLSGGTTPKAMYRVLLEHHRDAMDDFLRTDYFLGDERSVPWDNPQSNAGEAFRLFLDPVGVAQGRRHFANGGAPDLVRESEHATSLMKRIVPANAAGVPEFDLVLLGMGTDGHTASLFPGTEALNDPAARFVLNGVPQLQTSRITATYPLINAARHAVILATGENKSQHIADIFSREGDPVYPIERIGAQRTSWMLDATAASRLA
jgi:6-phosphogluconolactonase